MSIITLYKLNELRDLSPPRCPDCLCCVKQMRGAWLSVV